MHKPRLVITKSEFQPKLNQHLEFIPNPTIKLILIYHFLTVTPEINSVITVITLLTTNDSIIITLVTPITPTLKVVNASTTITLTSPATTITLVKVIGKKESNG